MGNLQAQIQILVDFHSHDGGTAKLAALTPIARQAFLRASSDALHGGRLGDFLLLGQGSAFRPVLTHEAGTLQPSLLHINNALVEAVVAYNEMNFGLRFDTDFAANEGAQDTAIPPLVCVQWVWVNGEWVKKFNYDLHVIDGTPPSSGNLQAAYRVALSYTT